MSETTFEIESVKEILSGEKKLCIPNYQRPYKWSQKNIIDLLTDISEAIERSRGLGSEFKYRIGTVILHKWEGKYYIVDGQQRIITLSLISEFLEHPEFSPYILTPLKLSSRSDAELSESELKEYGDTIFALRNKETVNNISSNRNYISDWFASRPVELRKDFADKFKSLLEMVVITVTEQAEAFQLFDSQNSRGKSLEPHDLLKAYHLRELKDDIPEMKDCVQKWEAEKSKDIENLFNYYLFPVYNWSRLTKDKGFTVKEIDLYKGVRKELPYTFALRTLQAMPVFQMTEQFIAGKDFFGYVDHYLKLLKEIKKSCSFEYIYSEFSGNEKYKSFKDIEAKLNERKNKFAVYLFYCVLLMYYDKFRNLDKASVKKLFLWAMMIREDMQVLSYKTINNYAIGKSGHGYTNEIPMFRKILDARLSTDIANIHIKLEKRNNPDSDFLTVLELL